MTTPLRTLGRSIEWRWFARFATGVALAIFINDNIAETTFIDGSSMAPTLSPDFATTRARDLMLWNKWMPVRRLRRGDVVYFSTPHRPEALGVKRVIALEGDIVTLDPRRRPRRKEGPEPVEAKAWDAWKGTVRVPAGHVWVEGDAAENSRDSNEYGPVSRSLIVGRAVRIVWPLERFGMRPWVGFKSRTKVKEARVLEDWTKGLPIELSEIRDPHLPR